MRKISRNYRALFFASLSSHDTEILILLLLFAVVLCSDMFFIFCCLARSIIRSFGNVINIKKNAKNSLVLIFFSFYFS